MVSFGAGINFTYELRYSGWQGLWTSVGFVFYFESITSKDLERDEAELLTEGERSLDQRSSRRSSFQLRLSFADMQSIYTKTCQIKTSTSGQNLIPKPNNGTN